MTPRCSFYTVKQQLQLFGTQAETGAFAPRPSECAFFKAFGTNPQATSIPIKELYPVSQFVGEEEKVATQRILRQYCLHMSVEPIETAPHIDRGECHKNARCRREAQHRTPLSSRARSRMGSASRQRTVRPDGETSSIAQVLLGGTAGGASLISLKTTGTGRFEACFVFASHQLRVASGIPCCRENAARVRPLRRNCSTI